jgi:hypothetical protein
MYLHFCTYHFEDDQMLRLKHVADRYIIKLHSQISAFVDFLINFVRVTNALNVEQIEQIKYYLLFMFVTTAVY